MSKRPPLNILPFAGEAEMNSNIDIRMLIQQLHSMKKPWAGNNHLDGAGNTIRSCFNACLVHGLSHRGTDRRLAGQVNVSGVASALLKERPSRTGARRTSKYDG